MLTDSNTSGFAYGGIYPGRLHAKGRLVDTHEVSFSVAKVGTYLLYVSLHGNQAKGTTNRARSARASADEVHIPGSPFMLTVSPGPAHPLSTKLPNDALPLRGELIQGDEPKDKQHKWQCMLKLQTCDKMGNLCDGGGAKVTCGYLDGPPHVAEEMPGKAFGLVSDDGGLQDPSASPGSRRGTGQKAAQEASTIDNKDGSYTLKWTSNRVGSYHIFVKIDGLHVLGSPMTLQNPPPRQVATVAAPVAVAVKPDPKARRMRPNNPTAPEVATAPTPPSEPAPTVEAPENAESKGETPMKKRRSSIGPAAAAAADNLLAPIVEASEVTSAA